MAYRAILSKDRKVGSFSDQRQAFSQGVEERIVEIEMAELGDLFAVAIREGDILLMAHARVLGRARPRQLWLDRIAEKGVLIQLPGGVPQLYDTPQKQAVFHAEAVKPTGRASRKQAKLKGRPRKYPVPSPEKKEILCGWWNTPMSDGKFMKFADVIKNAEQLLGHKVTRDFMKNTCGKSRGKISNNEEQG